MAKSGIGGLVKWLLVPTATLVVGYLVVGPQLGGKIVSTASKTLPIPKEVKASVSKVLTPATKNTPEQSETRDEPAPEPEAVPVDSAPEPKATQARTKSRTPEVEVSVREATVMDSSTTSKPRGRVASNSSVATADPQSTPKKKKRRKPKKAPVAKAPTVRQPEVLDEGGSGGAIGDPASGGGDPAGAPPPEF